ncbi:MAG: hypothetical protein U1F67_16070 [Rubrivivax sp.]
MQPITVLVCALGGEGGGPFCSMSPQAAAASAAALRGTWKRSSASRRQHLALTFEQRPWRRDPALDRGTSSLAARTRASAEAG